jgi:beta-lactamase regulating signal transducer with metallopeptidase domain
MASDLIVLFLLKANIAAALAILVVLVSRVPVRTLIGPSQAYWLWALVPLAAATSLFPGLQDFLGNRVGPLTLTDTATPGAGLLLTGFLVGAAGLLALFIVSELRFRRLAREGEAGPAVMGFSWPRLVVPADYRARFDAAERQLIGLHEWTHVERNHHIHNRLIAVAQLLGWFNPLVHLAASCMRLDQELACDAAVMERHGRSRRLYAETLMKAHATSPWSAFACALADGGRHPLEVRIGALRSPPVSLRRYMMAAALVAALGAITALGIWTLSPQTYG